MAEPVPRYRDLNSRSHVAAYYEYSGAFNLKALAITLPATCAVGIVCAAISCWATLAFMNAKMCLFTNFFSGIALGCTASRLLMRYRVRNLPLSMSVVTMAALFTSYFFLICLLTAVMKPASPAMDFLRLLRADVAFKTAEGITLNDPTDKPLHHIDSLSGASLAYCGLTEGATVLAAAWAMAARGLKERPYCEKCNRWCSGPKLLRRTEPVNLTELKARLEADDLECIAQIPLSSREGACFDFVQYRCEKCWQLSTLSVRSISAKERETKIWTRHLFNKRDLIRHLLVSCSDLERMSPWASPGGGGGRR